MLHLGAFCWVLWPQWRGVHSSKLTCAEAIMSFACWPGLVLVGSTLHSVAKASDEFVDSPSIQGPHLTSLRLSLLCDGQTALGSSLLTVSAYRKLLAAWGPSLRLPRQPKKRPLFCSPQPWEGPGKAWALPVSTTSVISYIPHCAGSGPSCKATPLHQTFLPSL